MSKLWLGGSTGFLGTHLSELLIASEHEAVLCSRSGGVVAGQQVARVDVLDASAVAQSARGCDGAFLCTGMVSRNPDDAGSLHQLHVEGTKSALLGLKQAGVKRVVVASTSGTIAVGTCADEIFDEDAKSPMEHIAAWPYYRSKYFGERAALALNDENFEVIVVNPSLLLGPGDLRESSTGDVRLFLEKAVLATPAGGLAFVDARDAAIGMLLAFEKGRPGERYLLNAANMTVAHFFGRLARISGVSAPLMKMPKNRALARGMFGLYDKGLRAIGGVPPLDAESAELGQYFWYCSSEKAERELGFHARDPGETLRDTVQDLVERKVVAPAEMRR